MLISLLVNEFPDNLLINSMYDMDIISILSHSTHSGKNIKIDLYLLWVCHTLSTITNNYRQNIVDSVDVVLIGHSKTFVLYNEKTLEPFLKRVSKYV